MKSRTPEHRSNAIGPACDCGLVAATGTSAGRLLARAASAARRPAGGTYCCDVRVGTVMVVGAVLASACSGSSGSGGHDLDPISLAGETDQGLRMRLDVVGEREIELRFPVDCGMGADRGDQADRSMPPTPAGSAGALEWHPLRAEVAPYGSFVIDHQYVDNEDRVDVHVEGNFRGDGTATGTLRARIRIWDEDEQRFDPPCRTGTVRWTADEPVPQGDHLVVPTEPALFLQPLGPDLLVVPETHEAVRLDHATGEARRLDGSSPAGAGSVPGGAEAPGSPGGVDVTPGTAVVEASPGGFLSGPKAVPVAGGVWMPDPATGAVTRTELADGRKTATLAGDIDEIATAHGAIWTVSSDPWNRTVYRLERRDPVTGSVVASAPVDRGVLVGGPSGLWHVYGTLAGEELLVRIDPETLTAAETFEIDVRLLPDQVVVTEDRVWFLTGEGVTSVDAATGRQSDVELRNEVQGMAADRTGIWVADPRESVIRRIEDDEVVRTVDVPGGRRQVAVTDDGAVWLSGEPIGDGDPNTPEGHETVRLDPAVTGG